MTRRLYLLQSEQLGLLPPQGQATAARTEKPASPWPRRLAFLSVPVILVAPLALWADLCRYLAPGPPVRVTAHRGHSLAAPENTLSAVRKAIASGADYAEVDVQQTADGVVVLLHDRDLKRVAGVPRRIEELSYDGGGPAWWVAAASSVLVLQALPAPRPQPCSRQLLRRGADPNRRVLDHPEDHLEAEVPARVRRMSSYLERHLGLDLDPSQVPPERQQIVLVNREEVEAARKEGGACDPVVDDTSPIED